MAGDRCNLMSGAAGLSEAPTCRFSQAMSAAPAGQPSLVAPFPEKIAEASRRERLPLGSREEGQVIAWARLEDLRQCRVDRDFECPTGLALPHDDRLALDVLPPHNDNV